MSTFNYDWTSQNIPLFLKALGPLKGQPIKGLEIGSFEGRSAVWFFENVLTHRDSGLHCIDTFEGSVEHNAIDLTTLEATFCNNLAPWRERLTVYKGLSHKVLPKLADTFDFIYVDGSHEPRDVCLDGILAWSLLKPGGVMIFDDFLWGGHLPEHKRPRVGIEAFLAVHATQFTVIEQNYAIAIRRNG